LLLVLKKAASGKKLMKFSFFCFVFSDKPTGSWSGILIPDLWSLISSSNNQALDRKHRLSVNSRSPYVNI